VGIISATYRVKTHSYIRKFWQDRNYKTTESGNGGEWYHRAGHKKSQSKVTNDT